MGYIILLWQQMQFFVGATLFAWFVYFSLRRIMMLSVYMGALPLIMHYGIVWPLLLAQFALRTMAAQAGWELVVLHFRGLLGLPKEQLQNM